jgi:hypothetical protein
MVQFLLDFSRGSGAAKGMQNSRRSSGGHHVDLKVALRHQLRNTAEYVRLFRAITDMEEPGLAAFSGSFSSFSSCCGS